MSTSTRMSTRKDEAEKKKVKKKMSKVQIQQAIIKKKQCDTKALAIVEQLLEPNVDPDWLLNNLVHINRSHMEDVIEERAIVQLCGYVLCNKAITVVIKQQYHISTKKNKVYDVSRRKNFCSSKCYGASNYLLEQLLTSPLWLRDKEEIPLFKFLPSQEELVRSIPGDEIHVRGTDPLINTEENSENLSKGLEEEEECEEIEIKPKQEPSEPIPDNKTDQKLPTESLNNTVESSPNENTDNNIKCLTKDSKTSTNKTKKRVTFGETFEKTFNPGNDLLVYPEVQDVREIRSDLLIDDEILEEDEEAETNESGETAESKSKTDITREHKREKNKDNKSKKDKQESTGSCKFYTLAMRVEKNVKEWFTEDTIRLLSGEEDTKNRLLENVSQHDKYLQLCKKLNKLQLEDDKTDLPKSNLKPLPHLSVLQEEGKKMELKVRAFFKGKMVVEEPENTEGNNVDEDSAPVLPLTDAHAPKALRRRIFMDKLHKILSYLLKALAGSKPHLLTEYAYSSEKNILIKALVNTFALSATNIIFKTAEWTLVGLIIIKMLSILDGQMKILLATKQATMYISMILMSYKLDSNYLDRLVIELTNNPKIFASIDTQ